MIIEDIIDLDCKIPIIWSDVTVQGERGEVSPERYGGTLGGGDVDRAVVEAFVGLAGGEG